MDITAKITEELHIKKSQTEAAIRLIDEGNTIPFIARYRKEATGSLNDEQLRDLDERLKYLRGLEDKKATVLASIEEQGKLTDELRKKIEAAETMVAVEDLYLPYKQKRKTRASIAREKGLEPLAALILMQTLTGSLEDAAAAYISEEKDVKDAAAAIQGAKDILAEEVADNADYRAQIRKMTWKDGLITSARAVKRGAAKKAGKTGDGADAEGASAQGKGAAGTAAQSKAAAAAKTPAQAKHSEDVYEMYYEFEEQISKIVGHRILALNRGEAEKVLTVKVQAPKEDLVAWLGRQIIRTENPVTTPVLQDVAADAYDRLIAPAIERDIRNELTEKAQDSAIDVFGKNLGQLLMQPPIAGKTVLGWDPAFRTGCKLAVVDPTGKVLDTKVIYPTAPQNKVAEAKVELKKLVDRYHIDLISVGNGTASRESEQVIADFIHELGKPLQYVIVNEAGASVYSASKLATEEFPQFDVGQRSAASIARRLQDPLAELVKIDPKSIGVGQYQHDMDQKKLGEALGGVVEDCVNKVGVDLNTASASLLTYISGINKTLAKSIVDYREANGSFKNRRQLLKVPKLGPKAFEQCAGFLRIRGGDNPLDDTSVHPESYEAAEKLMKKLGFSMTDMAKSQKSGGKTMMAASSLLLKGSDPRKLAQEMGVGEITLKDIISELEKPSRDPREDAPAPILRSDVMDLKDLQPGMTLKGTVRNIVDFGAFVDIGVHQDGLVHVSQLSDRFIKHPLEAVHVGDIVNVRVLSVDVAKKRIALTMRKEK